ncbi:MAG: hypothetical protein V4676_01305 [Bacteroidota bacterium]
MGVIIRISKNNTAEKTQKALSKLKASSSKKQTKTLVDFYGRLPNIFGDGLTFQKVIRGSNER